MEILICYDKNSNVRHVSIHETGAALKEYLQIPLARFAIYGYPVRMVCESESSSILCTDSEADGFPFRIVATVREYMTLETWLDDGHM